MKDEDFRIVTIDGAAASGKSSTARGVARRLNFMHLDTGALYRVLTYYLLKEGVRAEDEELVERKLSKLNIGTVVEDGCSRMTLYGQLPKDEGIRTDAVNKSVSLFASMPSVRAFLLNYQRWQVDIARAAGMKGLVADGRDVGSVVFPKTQHKFYLYANEEARAKRRELEGVADSITDRDKLDTQRKASPLVCEEGTYCIDNTNISLEEVISLIVEKVAVYGPQSEKKLGVVYGLGRGFAHGMLSLLHDAEARGVHHVPKTGPFLLACNHASFYDPFLAGAFIRRHIFFFARKTLFDNPVSAWFLKRFNAIPVDRDEGRDSSALKRSLKVLKQNHGLLVFPEGTRTYDGKLQAGKRGVGLMACKTQVPVVPVRFHGSYEAWGRHTKVPVVGEKITVIYGPPLMPSEYDPGKEHPNRYQYAADKMIEAIGRL